MCSTDVLEQKAFVLLVEHTVLNELVGATSG